MIFLLKPVVLKKSAFPQWCFHFEICQPESLLQSRRELCDPPPLKKKRLFAPNAFRKEEKNLYVLFLCPHRDCLIPDAAAYFCLLPYFEAIFSLPKHALRSTASPAALGEGLACGSCYLWTGRQRQADTVNASDISRSYCCPTKEVRMPSEASHGAFKTTAWKSNRIYCQHPQPLGHRPLEDCTACAARGSLLMN